MRNYLLFFFLGFFAFSQAQKSTYIYFVSFKDKKASAYDVKNPSAFLSSQALKRRQKFHISIDETDLPVNETYIKKVCTKKIKFKSASKWFNGILVEVEDTDLMASVAKNDFVIGVEKVAHYNFKTKNKNSVDWDFNYPIQDTSHAKARSKDAAYNYGKAYQQINMLQGIALHQRKYTGTGVTIAVLDAGFYNAHRLHWIEKLQASSQILATRDFVDNDNYVFDGNGHGLEVLSCMAATDTSNYIGTAPGANYLLLRSEDAETEQMVEELNWAIAAEFADSFGVDLITTSLGYTTHDDPAHSHSYSDLNGHSAYVSRAAEMAFAKGILVVCSAGNEGSNPWHKIGFPADAPHALTIGAVNIDRDLAEFSSVGPTADGRTKPDVCALGVFASVETPEGEISAENGTSFSTPITAGLVACLLQAHPDKTPQQINDAIRKSADRAEISDTLFGSGIPDFNLADFILGDTAFDKSQDILFDISYFESEKLLGFSIYSATTQTFGFKILDENGTVVKLGTQSCDARKIKRFYLDDLQLPMSHKGYAFVLENEAHQTFIKLFK